MQQSSGVKLRLIATALVILFGPAMFYFVISRGSNKYKSLEIYGPRDFKTSGNQTDTVYHQVGNFRLTDQYGNMVTKETFRNRVYVANFFTTRDTIISRKMSEGLQDVAYAFRNDTLLAILSHTIDPEFDSVPVLLEYAQRYKARQGKWFFVTGNKLEIIQLVRKDYYLQVSENASGSLVLSEKLVLIDTSGRIRGIYDSSDAWEIYRLKDEIKVLEFECFGKVYQKKV